MEILMFGRENKETNKFSLKGASFYEKNLNFEYRLYESLRKTFLKVGFVLSVLFIFGLVINLFTKLPYEFDRVAFLNKINGQWDTAIFAFVGCVVTVYWNLDSHFGRKWTTVVDKFYLITTSSENPEWVDRHLINVWHDALRLKVWADPAINELIFCTILKALEYRNSTLHNFSVKLETSNIRAGRYTKKQIEELLQEYQNYLISKRPPKDLLSGSSSRIA